MSGLLFRHARILTLDGAPRPRRGAALRELGVIARGDVWVDDGKIAAVGVDLPAPPGAEVIEAGGRVLMPGFVDCHTHACHAGDRLDEWDLKRQGASYLEILQKGGGIHATVAAVRAATRKQLAANLRAQLDLMLRAGTTTAEVKSGYGLNLDGELKMLHAIQRAAHEWPGTVVPTALLGHAVEGEVADFTRMVVRDLLPQVWHEFPGVTIDAYCEKDAWPVEACVRLFERARGHGLPIRVHADQFNSLGMVAEAVRLHAVSVDHLDVTTAEDAALLGQSHTFGVILPVSSFHLGGRYARTRKLLEAGGLLALATNCNPGSAPTHSMPLAIALAVRHCGLTPAEAIAACTVNAASLLGLNDRGMIAPGLRADLILLRHRDERMLAYELGDNPVDMVVCAGKKIGERA